MPASLHTHSWYSLLEGVSSPAALLERARRVGYTALAQTDVNNLYGAAVFVDEARRVGVKPLLGAALREGSVRCVALIAEAAGYRGLCRILSRLHLGAGRPGLLELLREQSEGLHVLVEEPALAAALREAYPGRLWLEIVRAGPSPRGRTAEPSRLEAGRRLGLPFLASTAAHFATADDHATHRLASVLRAGTLLEQLPRQLPITPGHHLVDPRTLCRWFADMPEAVANTDRLAEQLSSDVLPARIILPPARVPRHLEAQQFLRLLGEKGLRRRGLAHDARAAERLREELALIATRALAPYFLVVRDIARHARNQNYSMALRGSAGNSLVCYLLGITDVNPLRFGLTLGRFLHPGRVDLPDIDLDFDWQVRDQVIERVFARYGPARTAMICTHQMLQPRSAFREAAKAHGLSNEQIGQWLETMEEPVEALVEPRAAGPRGPASGPASSLSQGRGPDILRDARRLLGLPHHLSVHPGGVIITPGPLEDHAPLERAAKGVIVTQYEKDAVERLGLVKIDLLGNRALGTVDETRIHVRQGERRDVSPTCRHAGPMSRRSPDGEENDPAPLALLQRGDTLGLNQLESPAMRHLLTALRPRAVEDVIAALALVRPGAASGNVKERFLRRRRGLESFSLHPLLEPVLGATFGCMIYEDDGLAVVEALTGFSIAETHRFFKRLCKCESADEEHELAGVFLRACAARGVPRALAVEQFVLLTKFRYYSFCKSHAVSYGLIAWRACALKARHPAAFWTAALNNNMGMYPRRVYVEAIKRAGIELRLPCVNRSLGPFAVEDGAIRVGLDAIAGLPLEFKERLLGERDRAGPFRDLLDLRRRVEPGPCLLAALIRCGAFDFTHLPRPALILQAELQDQAREALRREGTLFADEDDPTQGWLPDDYPRLRRLRDEWELLGFVVGPSLWSLFAPGLPDDCVKARDLARRVGQTVRVAGVVATYRHTDTSDGRPMQFISLEDDTGLSELNLFPGNCRPLAHLRLGPYVATGLVEESLDVVTVNVMRLELAAGPGHELKTAGTISAIDRFAAPALAPR